jgi:hypothetical protein
MTVPLHSGLTNAGQSADSDSGQLNTEDALTQAPPQSHRLTHPADLLSGLTASRSEPTRPCQPANPPTRTRANVLAGSRASMSIDSISVDNDLDPIYGIGCKRSTSGRGVSG